jgi:hypothetical protein
LSVLLLAGGILPAQAADRPGSDVLLGSFICALGDKIDVLGDVGSAESIKLVWKGKSYSLTSVETSTGAVRYEDKKNGYVWIQIPQKSMLLNSKTGRQVANDCQLPLRAGL